MVREGVDCQGKHFSGQSCLLVCTFSQHIIYKHHHYQVDTVLSKFLYSVHICFSFREMGDQIQGAVTQLEQERTTALKRLQRTQEELKKKLLVRRKSTCQLSLVIFDATSTKCICLDYRS